MAYSTRLLGKAVLTLATALALVAPSAADRLVTTDGNVLVTRGAWKVNGAMVVFSTPEGTLVSLRLDDVDLEASREATAKAAGVTAGPRTSTPAVKRESVIVLTDRDVNHVSPSAPQADRPPVGAAGAPAAAAAASGAPAATAEASPPRAAAPAKPTGAGGRLVVRQWHEQRNPAGDGIIFTGEIANTSDDVVGNIQLSVVLKDRAGQILESKTARLTSSILQPEKFSSFRADFPGLYVYDDIAFQFDGFALEVGPERPSGIGTTPDG